MKLYKKRRIYENYYDVIEVSLTPFINMDDDRYEYEEIEFLYTDICLENIVNFINNKILD